MRRLLLILLLMILTAPTCGGTVRRTALHCATSAAIGTARNAPHEWGRGPAGFGKRFASSIGHHVVKQTISLGVSAWHHEDPRYYRSNLYGTWPRVRYAVANTFIAHRTNRSGKTVALGRLSGDFGSGLISRAWQPASTAGIGAGFASGGITLGAEVGFNVTREFWPRKVQSARR